MRAEELELSVVSPLSGVHFHFEEGAFPSADAGESPGGGDDVVDSNT